MTEEKIELFEEAVRVGREGGSSKRGGGTGSDGCAVVHRGPAAQIPSASTPWYPDPCAYLQMKTEHSRGLLVW